MKTVTLLLAGVAMAVTATTAFAQADAVGDSPLVAKRKMQNGMHYGRQSAKYRPLTVSAKPMTPPPAPMAPGAAIGGALASPFNAIGGVGGPVGFAGTAAGSAVSGATSLAFAPLAGLTGGTVGISGDVAPPLPIKARYAGTGKVASTYDEGYAQDVPVDASGPIYQLDEGVKRKVTPFTLAAFPITAATTAIIAPVHAIVP